MSAFIKHIPVFHIKSFHASSSLMPEEFGLFLGKMHVMMDEQRDTSSAQNK